MGNTQSRIGFISFRLAGTDGVSLETLKWSNILTGLGHECFYFAGESDWPEEHTLLVPEAHFTHPEIKALRTDLFDDYDYVRSPQASRRIQKIKDHLKDRLYEFKRSYRLDLLIVENALSIPLNIPLGLALTEFIGETSIPTIGHHHDFPWERERFAVNAILNHLRADFPPTLPSIHHVVINSYAGRVLAFLTGVSSTLIPNVMDFDSPPPEPDRYADDFRPILDIGPDEYLLLQPTRVVPRKRIELAIELARRLDLKCTLVISYSSGDEGTAYETYLRDYADLMGVRVLFATEVIAIAHDRGQTPDGRKIYSLADIYQQADLITYPSWWEGFGNAFVEAIYYRRPILMSTYEVFKTDIQPKGFKVIGFQGFITQDCVRRARDVLFNRDLVDEMTDHNYELGRRHYSYRTLEKRLVALISECLGD